MNWLTLLQYMPMLLGIIPRIQHAFDSTATNTNSVITNLIQEFAPQLAPMLEDIGKQIFPNLAEPIHIAAGAIVAFHPNAVMWMQDALNHADNAGLAVDGHFGPLTLAAVKAFQAKHGLAVTGFIDDIETALLTKLLAD
jgi:murein L,D-transpeptidase YcbB/YkuD